MKRHKAELIFLSSGAHGTESDYVNKELCRQLLEELNCQYWNNVKIVLRPEHVLVHSEADEKQIERKSDADGNSSDMGTAFVAQKSDMDLISPTLKHSGT